ncbi:DMT family transporter [Ramlibacter sp. AW1]|uniref:DMT family transporter n=1 Tax=Ramlibacter aurantiacus TaxID=2801330 RepID=A0A936ZUC1_9BURK|nr:DMT family transporter [Ramlibacter aurantiacus]MBL0421305.1 DMT family transporter [Ramlibacter aurantiacus]
MAERPWSAGAAPALALVANAFIWGVSWWPFRQLQQQGLHPLWGTAVVFAVAAACVLAVRPAAFAQSRAHVPQLLLLGVVAGLTNVGFNWGITVGDVVRVVLLFYLMPAWSVILAWPLLGERPSATSLLRLLLALLGVLVVLDTGGGWPMPRELADWLGLLSGAGFALTNILLRRLRHAPAPSRVLAMFAGGGVIATALGLFLTGHGVVPSPAPTPHAAVFVALLVAGFLVGNVALQYGAARLAAHTTALIMLSEVVFASASAVLLTGAVPGLRTWLGGALILAAAAWAAWPGAPGARRVVAP